MLFDGLREYRQKGRTSPSLCRLMEIFRREAKGGEWCDRSDENQWGENPCESKPF